LIKIDAAETHGAGWGAGFAARGVRVDNCASMYNADYRKRLPAEPHKFQKTDCITMHVLLQTTKPSYTPKSALLSLITLSIYILMIIPYTCIITINLELI
jgi:hypothetical protein